MLLVFKGKEKLESSVQFRAVPSIFVRLPQQPVCYEMGIVLAWEKSSFLVTLGRGELERMQITSIELIEKASTSQNAVCTPARYSYISE